jgi:methionyl-tRNA synthetase
MMIGFEEFKKMDIRIASITNVQDHPDADKLYLITAEIGKGTDGAKTEKTFVAGIKKYYTKEELIGKQIVVLTNLEPAVIRGVTSDCMLLAASDKDKKNLAVITTDKTIDIGSKVS